MATKTRLVTYDDYRTLPDDGKRYEIIRGELFMTPAPTTIHQRILGRLYKLISDHVENNHRGEVFMAPVDVVLSMTDIIQPDLVFVAKDRSHIITKKNIVEAPDLVVEILSEHNAAIDRIHKKALYERYGVKEYWIVDPNEKQIEQYILKDEVFELNAQSDTSEKLSSDLVEGLSIQFDMVFSTE